MLCDVFELLPAVITTAGALLGSFGGFAVAARGQRKQLEAEDARAEKAAARHRLTVLEDERHEFQLKTLLALQELIRRRTRSVYLAIEHDRSTLADGQGYGLLPKEGEEEDFDNAIQLSQHVTRVTSTELRQVLEHFAAQCSRYSLPPSDGRQMGQSDAVAVQLERRMSLITEANDVTALLGEHLRKEINRHEQQVNDAGSALKSL